MRAARQHDGVDEVEKAVDLIDGRCKIEVSGGVTLDTVGSYAETGVDFISVGAHHELRAGARHRPRHHLMLLTIDAGNTQTVVGLFHGHELVDHWRIATDADRTSDELALMVQQFLGFHGFSFALPGIDGLRVTDRGDAQLITGVAICSGVPRVTAELRQMTERYFGFPALVLEPGVRTGMPILYDNPKEVGADRIANAVGAYDLYGGPTIVVDFGTATTIEAISAKGEYLGGAIFPGVEIAMDALFGRAAGLRRVELQPPEARDREVDLESIQSGAIYGFSAQVDGLVDRFVAELGECTVISTGGLADLISPHARTVQHYEPWLTLYGLRIIFERNT